MKGMKMKGMKMTPIDFIASLDGESKASALTIYNLMTPLWIEIDHTEATLPEIGVVIVARLDTSHEFIGVRTLIAETEWCWSMPVYTFWDWFNACLDFDEAKKQEWVVTHWRAI